MRLAISQMSVVDAFQHLINIMVRAPGGDGCVSMASSLNLLHLLQ